MLVAASPVLSEMARALRSWSQHIEPILKRLSRNLASRRFAPETFRMRILEHNALFVERDTPVHIDLSDISKPHARKMPCLCKVRDASNPRRPVTTLSVPSRFASRAVIALSSTSQSHARATTPVH